ncbi:hypothetical protein [Mesorhizobium sp. M1B.F.Ca.ET.045.04.1.1]|uniref:hypothetical protein n=1 Tax=Mesorhizobium sp. M1B.F.Ca.ET.045.04.1.1 TaxID=2493673 RepID=UPI000F759692|nr:hypothetical protein [Mesorhizobium sp. M1B.F.Ca.ET.045.04.1.1]AZO29796.1 hypothetical protein EJ071_21935 [Mesorhizobium sp. M1B.F.Ca.ET.045.04.1.1]
MDALIILADLMLHGHVCEHCGGDYREKAYGYPRACKQCQPDQMSTVPGVFCEVFNRGLHHRYARRFHYWPSRQKWWDEATNVKGVGEKSFRRHVSASLMAHAIGQRNLAH